MATDALDTSTSVAESQATNAPDGLEDGELGDQSAAVIDMAAEPPKSVRDDLSVEEQALLDKMSANPRLKQMLASPSLKAMLVQVLDAKKRHDDASFNRLEREIRKQGQSGGIQPLEESFLADFVLGSEEFKQFVQELINSD